MKKTIHLITLLLLSFVTINAITAKNADDLVITLPPIENTTPIDRLEVKNFNTLRGGDFYEYEYNFFQYGYYYGEQIVAHMGFVNNQSQAFEGQYGIAIAFYDWVKDDITNEAFTKYLIYESPEITVAPGSEILDTIRTKGLEVLKYREEGDIIGGYQLTPIIKEKGESNWKILNYDKKPIFDTFITENTAPDVFCFQGNVTCSAKTVDKLETFIVEAPVYCAWLENPQDELKVGLYKLKFKEGMHFTLDASPINMKTVKREGTKYYCEVQEDAIPGSYYILPLLKSCPETFDVSIASGYYRSFYSPSVSEGNRYSEYAILNVTDVIKGSSIEGNLAENISVYPNPVKDVLYIKGNTDNISGYKLVNIVGKTVRSGRNMSDLTSLNLSDLATGTYILVLDSKDSEKPVYFKVIKE